MYNTVWRTRFGKNILHVWLEGVAEQPDRWRLGIGGVTALSTDQVVPSITPVTTVHAMKVAATRSRAVDLFEYIYQILTIMMSISKSRT